MILLKLNSFDSQIQFTHEINTNNNDVHFLGIIITPILALHAVYRKSTHIGECVHLFRFTLWCRKISWLRAVVYRAYKICDEQLRIMNSPILLNLLFGTCFRNDLLIKFKNQFTPKLPNNPSNDDVIADPPINTPTI